MSKSEGNRGSILGSIGSVFSKARQSAFSYVQQMIDDKITQKLSPYLATGVGDDGLERSDVVVNQDGDISIENCVLRPSAVDALLAENEMPFHVVMAQCSRIFVDIPWGDLTNGEWTFEIEGLCIVVVPKERESWNIGDVRRVKESLIEKDLAKLIANLASLNAKPKKATFMGNLKNRFVASLKPVIRVKDVHLRFERFSNAAPIPFSFGFIMKSLEVEQSTSEDMQQETYITMSTSGVYCRTTEMAAASVLPADHVMYAKEPNFSLPKDRSKMERLSQQQERKSVGGAGSPPAPTDAALADFQEQIEMEKSFFRRQDAIRATMDKLLAAASEKWTPEDWFVGPVTIGEGKASMHVQQAYKLEPEKFDYEAPISVMRVALGHVGIAATEKQLAAFLSLTSFKTEYKLWSRYATRAPPIKYEYPTVNSSAAARAHWRLAKEAVLTCVRKGGINAGNITVMLQRAKAYKKDYYTLLVSCLKAETKRSEERKLVRAARRDLHSTDPALNHELHKAEDELPAGTLAWCRLVARQNAKTKLSGKGGDDDEGDGDMDTAVGGDDTAEALLKGKKALDSRVEEAPKGYVHKVTAISLSQFSLKFLKTPSVAEMANSIGKGESRESLLTMRMMGIDVRTRAIKDVGSTTHLVIRGMDVTGGSSCVANSGTEARKAGLPPPPAPTPIVFRVAGDTNVATSEDELGHHADWAGGTPELIAFQNERRQQLQSANCIVQTATFFGGKKRESINTPPSASSASRSRTSSQAGEAPKIRVMGANPRMAHGGGGSSSEDDDKEAPVGAPISAQAKQMLSAAKADDGAPAISVRMLTSTDPSVPHEMELTMQPMELQYFPVFFSEYDSFMRVLEAEKHSAQLSASALYRLRFPKLMRSVNTILAEKWHMPEQKMMTAFLSVCDLFDEPSAKHKLNVNLSGITFRLKSEKDAAEELMTFTLPPMAIGRTPKVGEPAPAKQHAEIMFGGALKIETPIESKCLRRVQQAQHAGNNDMSRMGGRLVTAVYSMAKEKAELEEQIRSLNDEVASLKAVFAGMRTHAVASVLPPPSASSVLTPRSPPPSGASTPRTAANGGAIVPSAAGIYDASDESVFGGSGPEAADWRSLVGKLEEMTIKLNDATSEHQRKVEEAGNVHDKMNDMHEMMKERLTPATAWGEQKKQKRKSSIGRAKAAFFGPKKVKEVEVVKPPEYNKPGGEA